MTTKVKIEITQAHMPVIVETLRSDGTASASRLHRFRNRSNDMKLPDLPEGAPIDYGYRDESGTWVSQIVSDYLPDQMRYYGKACTLAALEEAAKIVREMGPNEFEWAADEILKLKEQIDV